MTDRLHRVVAASQRGTMVSLHTSGARLAALVGRLDVDSVFIDMQHGAFDGEGARAIMVALADADITPVVRVPANDAATIARVVADGAGGIVCPLIETAEEAAHLVAACVQAAAAAGVAHDEVQSIALVESRRGYENLEAICATPGLDAIMVGSGDLAASMDGTLQLDESMPQVRERRDRMIQVAHAHGLWALASASVNSAANPFDSGADVLVISDNSVLIPALRRILATLREPRPVLEATPA